MPHFLFKHVLWCLLRKLQLYGKTLKQFRNIINVSFAVITFLLFCFFPLYPTFYFYNRKIKLNFFIFHMFSYFKWNFKCFGFFSYNDTFFCNFLKQFFVSVNSFLFLFYVIYCSYDKAMLTWQFLHSYPQLFTSSKYFLSPSSSLPQVCLPIPLLWFV